MTSRATLDSLTRCRITSIPPWRRSTYRGTPSRGFKAFSGTLTLNLPPFNNRDHQLRFRTSRWRRINHHITPSPRRRFQMAHKPMRAMRLPRCQRSQRLASQPVPPSSWSPTTDKQLIRNNTNENYHGLITTMTKPDSYGPRPSTRLQKLFISPPARIRKEPAMTQLRHKASKSNSSVPMPCFIADLSPLQAYDKLIPSNTPFVTTPKHQINNKLPTSVIPSPKAKRPPQPAVQSPRKHRQHDTPGTGRKRIQPSEPNSSVVVGKGLKTSHIRDGPYQISTGPPPQGRRKCV